MTLGRVLWQLRPGLLLRYRSWDQDEYVLFNNLSGDTHLVDAATIEVLTALHAQAHSLEALGSALQLEADPEALAALDELLHELRRLALVDCVC